jgi:dihydroorotase
MKDMLNVMSKYLNMGMSLKDIIFRATWSSANSIKRNDLGHLTEGAGADVAIFSMRKGKFGFLDAGGNKMPGTKKLECEMTIRDGKVVYDLNGIGSTNVISLK